MQHENTLQSLTLQLSHADPDIRARAAKMLASRGDERVLPALIDCLSRDPEPRVRAAAAHGLGQFGRNDLKDALLAALADPSAMVRMAAVEALDPDPDDTATLQAVIDALSDPDPDVRRSAAWILGEKGGGVAVPPLMACLEHETEQAVRRVLILALGELADQRARSILTACLDDSDELLRLDAETALGRLV